MRSPTGLLSFDLDMEYPSREVDVPHVRQVLTDHFKVKWAKPIVDPLGDCFYWDFTWGGEPFTLHWIFWTGLELIARHASGEDRLRQIAAYFEANPPPFLPPRK